MKPMNCNEAIHSVTLSLPSKVVGLCDVRLLMLCVVPGIKQRNEG